MNTPLVFRRSIHYGYAVNRDGDAAADLARGGMGAPSLACAAAANRCCPGCAYDLTGNVSGTCPECGKPLAKGAA